MTKRTNLRNALTLRHAPVFFFFIASSPIHERVKGNSFANDFDVEIKSHRFSIAINPLAKIASPRVRTPSYFEELCCEYA